MSDLIWHIPSKANRKAPILYDPALDKIEEHFGRDQGLGSYPCGYDHCAQTFMLAIRLAVCHLLDQFMSPEPKAVLGLLYPKSPISILMNAPS